MSYTPTEFKRDHCVNAKEGLEEQSKKQKGLKYPKIILYYKNDRFQKENLPIYNVLINNDKKEQ
ncbi:hypothetical protein ACISNP_09265 [Campylobacter jejuni]